MTKTLDLGCGTNPKNPFNLQEVFGIDVKENVDLKIFRADLAVEPIPFEDNFFDAITAFDFIEHIPRIIYAPNRRYCFVEMMNEIFRTLKPGGQFLSVTPAFPASAAWQDPTHVNIITKETFPIYFCNPKRLASVYGFNGYFKIESQKWHKNKIHLVTTMRKLDPAKE